MKLRLLAIGAALAVHMIVFAPPAQAEVPVVTGQQWMGSSADEKRAYLLGLFTMAGMERHIIATNPGRSRGPSLVPVLGSGLQGVSVPQVVDYVDRFYQTNPNQRNRAVVDVIYRDLAAPNAAQLR